MSLRHDTASEQTLDDGGPYYNMTFAFARHRHSAFRVGGLEREIDQYPLAPCDLGVRGWEVRNVGTALERALGLSSAYNK